MIEPRKIIIDFYADQYSKNNLEETLEYSVSSHNSKNTQFEVALGLQVYGRSTAYRLATCTSRVSKHHGSSTGRFWSLSTLPQHPQGESPLPQRERTQEESL